MSVRNRGNHTYSIEVNISVYTCIHPPGTYEYSKLIMKFLCTFKEVLKILKFNNLKKSIEFGLYSILHKSKKM